MVLFFIVLNIFIIGFAILFLQGGFDAIKNIFIIIGIVIIAAIFIVVTEPKSNKKKH